MGRIFISYRRDDNRDFVERLADHLKVYFGKSVIFQDVSSIPPGVDFREHVRDAIAHSDIELVIIGQRWLAESNSMRTRRIDNDNDPVRIEVEAALVDGVPIIPVLIDGVSMPVEVKLPSAIRQLADINAISVRRNPDFDLDMRNLAHAVRQKRLTVARRGWKAVQRYVTNRVPIIQRSAIVATTVLLIGLCAVALTPGSVLQLPILSGLGRTILRSDSPTSTALSRPRLLSPTAGITAGWSVLHPGYLALTLTGFPAGTYRLSCNFIGEKNIPPRVSQFAVTVLGSPDIVDDGRTCNGEKSGDEVFVTYGTLASAALLGADAFRTTPLPPTIVPETSGGIAHTWTDYTNSGGTEGPSVNASQTIGIACKIAGFKAADGNTWWYRIAQSPWNSQYYVSADAFYNNGQSSGSLIGTPWVDPNVPNC